MSSSTFSTAASSPGRPHSVHHVYFQPTNPDDVMVIEVNFGKGRKDDIFVAVGDDPLFLAQAFVEKHNLKPSAVNMIAEHISNSIEAYMARVEDEERSRQTSSPVSKKGDISFGVSPIREQQNINDSMFVNRATPLRHTSSGNWSQDVDAAAATVLEAEVRGSRRSEGGGAMPGHKDPEDEEPGVEQGESDKQETKELDSEGYNKLRNSWNGPSLVQSKSIFENQLSRSKKGSALIISKTKAADSRSVRLVVNLDDSKRGKALTTNERLYWGAKIQRERMEAKINQSAMTQDLEFRVGQESVRVKGKSKQLLKNYRFRGDLQLDVGERLYQDALRQKERREKDSAKAKACVKKEDWSCPLCCTFNEHPPRDSDPKLCVSCGWEGSIDEATFKPVAVDLHYSKSNIDREKLVKNYYKRRGVDNIGNDDKNGVFEHLYKNGIHNKEAMDLLQRRWVEEDNEMTFKPAIPGKSKQIAERHNRQLVNTSMQQSGDSGSMMSHLGIGERLYHQSTAAWDSAKQEAAEKAAAGSTQTVVPPKPSGSELEFVNRITYEYEDRKKRTEAMQRQMYSIDPKTAKPLFKPTIPKFKNPYALNVEEESVEIHEKLIRSGDERKFRLMQLQEEYRKLEMSEFKKSSHTLPTSQKMLEESSENSIGEIFRVLLTCQMHNEVKGLGESDAGTDSLDHERLLRLSAELSNWRQGVLDAANCDPDLMIDSVRHLLVEVVEMSHKYNCNAKYPELSEKLGGTPRLLDLEMFSVLIKRCIRNREGGGKSYLFLPRREPKPAPPVEEPTFKPVIDANSLKIVRDIRDKDVPIEDQLLNSQLEVRVRIEKSRQALAAREASQCTFRPELIPPPPTVRPTYRALASAPALRGGSRRPETDSCRTEQPALGGYDLLPAGNQTSSSAQLKTSSYGAYPGLRLALGQRQAEGPEDNGAPPPPPPEDPIATSTTTRTTTTTTSSDGSSTGAAREHIVPAESSDQYIGLSDSADPEHEAEAGQGRVKDSLASYLESARDLASR